MPEKISFERAVEILDIAAQSLVAEELLDEELRAQEQQSLDSRPVMVTSHDRRRGLLSTFSLLVAPTVVAGLAFNTMPVSSAHAAPADKPPGASGKDKSRGIDSSTGKSSNSLRNNTPPEDGAVTLPYTPNNQPPMDGNRTLPYTPGDTPPEDGNRTLPYTPSNKPSEDENTPLKNPLSRAGVEGPKKSDKTPTETAPSKPPKGENIIDKLKGKVYGEPGVSKKADDSKKEDQQDLPTIPSELYKGKKKPEGSLDSGNIVLPPEEVPKRPNGSALEALDGKTAEQQEIDDLAKQIGIDSSSVKDKESDGNKDKRKSSRKKATELKQDVVIKLGDKDERLMPLLRSHKSKKPEPAAPAEAAPAPEPAPEPEQNAEQRHGKRPERVSPETAKIIDKMSYLSPAKKEFYKNILMDVVAAAAENPEYAKNVNLEIMIAQAAIESGWGGSTLTTKHNAYFGIKVGSWPGAVAKDQPTKEFNGGEHTIKDSFRAYGSRQESVKDYMKFINTVKKSSKSGVRIYQKAIDNAATPEGYAKGLKDSGYATHPTYDKDLVSFAEQQKIAKLLELELQNYQEYNKRQEKPAPEAPAPPLPVEQAAPQMSEPEALEGPSEDVLYVNAALLSMVGAPSDSKITTRKSTVYWDALRTELAPVMDEEELPTQPPQSPSPEEPAPPEPPRQQEPDKPSVRGDIEPGQSLEKNEYAKLLGISESSLESGAPQGWFINPSDYDKLGIQKDGGYPLNKYPLAKGYDEWGMAYRQCTSYVAWKIAKENDGPPKMFKPGASALGRTGPANGGDWHWRLKGIYKVNTTPAAGAVINWDGTGAMHKTYGHVGYVEKILPNGAAVISEYNVKHRKFTVRLLPVTSVKDKSVRFTHVQDGEKAK